MNKCVDEGKQWISLTLALARPSVQASRSFPVSELGC